MKRIAVFSALVFLLMLLGGCAQLSEPRLEPLATTPSNARMYLAKSVATSFFATDSGQKEVLAIECPAFFGVDGIAGSLLTLSASGLDGEGQVTTLSGASACYRFSDQRLGVFTPGEDLSKRFSVNPGETFSISLGDDLKVAGRKATSAVLSTFQTKVSTLLEVQFYNGATLVGKKQISPTGSGTTPKLFTLKVTGKVFTRLVLKPVRGPFSLKGGRDVVKFTLKPLPTTAALQVQASEEDRALAPAAVRNVTYKGTFQYYGRHAWRSSQDSYGNDCKQGIRGTRTQYGHDYITSRLVVHFSGTDDGRYIYLKPSNVSGVGYGHESSGATRDIENSSNFSTSRLHGNPITVDNNYILLDRQGSAGTGGWMATFGPGIQRGSQSWSSCRDSDNDNWEYIVSQQSQQFIAETHAKNGRAVGTRVNNSGPSGSDVFNFGVWTWELVPQ